MRTIPKYGTAESRWAGVGPYYAMFPRRFADSVISRHSEAGDVVLDPFAGRGTSVYSAVTHDRIGVGIELNPVGWLYARTKLNPAPEERVRKRLRDLYGNASRYRHQADNLPEFFRHCFNPLVRRFLVAARVQLDWRRNTVDRTAMAFILINLHGKRQDSLSNQMRQTKAMSPHYSVRWWKERDLGPPDVDPLEFLLKRVGWRYAKGRPQAVRGRVYLGDSNDLLCRIRQLIEARQLKKAHLLFTSPPYCGITNYHYDQWLRLWALGGPPRARRLAGAHRAKFENKEQYRALLKNVLEKCAQLLVHDAVVYVRTDRRDWTCRTTGEVLREVFPRWHIRRRVRPLVAQSQTKLFGSLQPGLGEVDFIASRQA